MILIFIFLGAAFFSLCASYYTYCDQEITPSNLSSISCQYLLDQDKNELTQWMEKNPDIINRLIEKREPECYKWQVSYASNQRFLAERKIINYSTRNYVFDFKAPMHDYLIKISSTERRQRCLLNKKNNILHCATYVSAGRVLTSILIKKICEKACTVFIEPIPSYLISFPGEPENGADDNCFVVEEKIKNINLISNLDASEREDFFSRSQRLEELLFLTYKCGLWDMQENNVAIDEQKKLRILDCELPDTPHPKEYFKKNKQKRLESACSGIEGICRWFEISSEPRDIIQKWVEEHPCLQKASNYSRLLPYFDEI
jgi:hypothetical protein